MFFSKKTILIIVFTLITNSLMFAQWLPVSSGTTNSLYGVYMLPSGVGYAVGDMGTILKTTDSGDSWNSITSGVTDGLNNVYFFDDNTGIIVGDGGLILRTTNGGSSWTTIVVTDIYDRLLSVSFSGAYGIIGGESQTIIYSTNSGVSWTVSQTGYFGGGFWGVQMLNSTTGFVAGQNSISAPLTGKSTDGGANWNFSTFYFQSNEGRCEDVHFFDANNGIVSGSTWIGGGAISRTTDGGSNWTTTLFTNVLEGMDFPMASTGYAVGWSGSIIYTTDSGNTWTEQTTSPSNYYSDISFIPNTLTGVVVGTGGTMLRTDNGGLPVELSSFAASVNNKNVLLNWTTATEINNSGFNAERKSTSTEWQEIGFVPGFGTTTEPHSYSFNDAGLNSGTFTYRLRQVDFDGSFEYSNEVEVEIVNPVEYALAQNYPNPFNPSTRIEFTLPNNEMVNVSVYSSLGEKVTELVNGELTAGQHSVDFNAQGLASGIYIVKMNAGNFTDTRKMSLMK
jgi:photosystem II stability/assembly factor-like uncharacterized protein